jgi:hypothetical protein
MQHCWRSLGFNIDSMDDFKALGLRAAKSGTPLTTPYGTYIRWDIGGGPQLWVQIKQDTRIILGWHTHFAGRAQMRLALTRRMLTQDNDPLEGAFHGWADPRTDDATEGQYPLLFHAPNFAMYDYLSLPAVRTVQLTAFAHSLSVYPGDEEYFAAQTTTVKFAAESFLPLGLFPAKDRPDAPPVPFAQFAGHVLKAASLTNPMTGIPYHWARIRTVGGEADMVADTQTYGGAIAEGNVVSGRFWLSGHIVDTPKSLVQ